jgi:hypothetical protein
VRKVIVSNVRRTHAGAIRRGPSAPARNINPLKGNFHARAERRTTASIRVRAAATAVVWAMAVASEGGVDGACQRVSPLLSFHRRHCGGRSPRRRGFVVCENKGRRRSQVVGERDDEGGGSAAPKVFLGELAFLYNSI